MFGVNCSTARLVIYLSDLLANSVWLGIGRILVQSMKKEKLNKKWVRRDWIFWFWTVPLTMTLVVWAVYRYVALTELLKKVDRINIEIEKGQLLKRNVRAEERIK